MEAYLEWLQTGVDTAGVWFMVPFLALENIPIIGLFAPGLTVLVLSGFFHEILVSWLPALYIIAWLTIVCADSAMFLLGYTLRGRSARLTTLLKQAPDVAELLTKQSPYVLLGYQFIPYFRMFLPLALGAYRFSPLRWLPICSIGTMLYVGVFLSIGVVGAVLFQSVSAVDGLTTSINRFLAVFAICYGIILIVRYKKLKTA